MAFFRSGLALSSFSSTLVQGAVVAVGVLVVLSRTACIDGTTPSCPNADAGCGPGIEAGPDSSLDAAHDGQRGDARPADGAVGDALGDVGSEAATDAGTQSDARADSPPHD